MSSHHTVVKHTHLTVALRAGGSGPDSFSDLLSGHPGPLSTLAPERSRLAPPSRPVPGLPQLPETLYSLPATIQVWAWLGHSCHSDLIQTSPFQRHHPEPSPT